MTALYLAISYAWRGRTEASTFCFNCYCLPLCSSQTGTNPASIWLMFLLRQSSHLFKCIMYMHDPLLGISVRVAGNSMQFTKCGP